MEPICEVSNAFIVLREGSDFFHNLHVGLLFLREKRYPLTKILHPSLLVRNFYK